VQEGARVGALGRTADEVRQTVNELASDGDQAIPLIADVSRADEVERAVQELVDRWGRLDIVFANAGVNGVWAPVDDPTPDEWEHTLRINLTGTFLTVKYTVPYLKQQGGAVIINASVNGEGAWRYNRVYTPFMYLDIYTMCLQSGILLGVRDYGKVHSGRWC
jgi:NAD(P)-dependent dehydrogenase (short-subunit alcohol dehydrogenase family)